MAVIPEATNIITPIVEKHGYPPTQEGENAPVSVFSFCMYPAFARGWSHAGILITCGMAGASAFTEAIKAHENDQEIALLMSRMMSYFLPMGPTTM